MKNKTTKLDELSLHVQKIFPQYFPIGSRLEIFVLPPQSPIEVSMNISRSANGWSLGVCGQRMGANYTPLLELKKALQLRNTGTRLPKNQIRVLCDLLHELIHTLAVDYTLDQAKTLQVSHWHEYLEYYLRREGIQRLGLEMISEWYTREVFESTILSAGWELPSTCRGLLCDGYNSAVGNIYAVYNILDDRERFIKQISQLLHSPKRALSYRKLAKILKTHKIFSPEYKVKYIVELMVYSPMDDFVQLLPFMLLDKKSPH